MNMCLIYHKKFTPAQKKFLMFVQAQATGGTVNFELNINSLALNTTLLYSSSF